ncbi:MAG: c-type cytochrome biogenesis protein CcmI [Burkholderiaceae bacterium]
MGGFLIGAVVMVGLTVLLLLRPWKRQRPDEVATTREINTGIYRDQLAELDRDLAAGTIAGDSFEQARAELQRRLLDDAATAEVAPAPAPRRSHTTTALALAVPLLATGLYAWLGTPQALQPAPPPAAQVTAADVDQMLATLAARLEKNPDDPQGWTMLARSYRALGRIPEAQNAYEHIGESLNRDPVLMTEYADVIAAASGGMLEGKPLELVMAALQLDPDSGMALALAATAAHQRQDPAQAAAYWERLLKQLPPDSDDARWVTKTLADLRTTPAETAGNASPTGAASSPQAQEAGASASPSIRGSVSLAPELAARTQPTDTVFVFARAAEGPRMPLAVQRARVADLPLDFRLDDSMAVSPQFKLSSVPRVSVEARISRSGDATPAAGDLISAGELVQPGAGAVTLRIDRVRP